MTKMEFLTELKKRLGGLPSDDIQRSLDYYAEMIDDCIEDGFLEEEAVSQIGNIEDIAKQILVDIPLPKLVKQKMRPKHHMGVGEIILLILGSPIWVSLLIAAVAVVFSVYVSLWSVIVSLWASFVACVGSAFGGFAAAVILFASGQNIYAGMVMIAAALVLVGISILFFFMCQASTKGMVWLTKKITLFIKSCFLRKERSQ